MAKDNTRSYITMQESTFQTKKLSRILVTQKQKNIYKLIGAKSCSCRVHVMQL